MRSEAEILKSISIARGTSEPAQAEPTDVSEVVDVSDETPVETEEVTEVVAEATPEAEPVETEEEASTDTPEADNSNDEELYVEVNGREVALSEVGEWEQGSLRQADYTRKTQELAEQRKTFEAERSGITEQQEVLAAKIAELDVIISEGTLSAEDLTELREYDPEEFIKYQEKVAKRKEMLGAAKDVQPANNIDVEAERSKIWDANPTWMKDGKPTDALTNDMKAMAEVGLSAGYTSDEMNLIVEAKHFELFRLAAIGAKSLKSNAALEKKVRKAPVTTKPRAALKSSLVTKIDAAKKRLKQTGSSDDYMNLRKLQRQAEE